MFFKNFYGDKKIFNRNGLHCVHHRLKKLLTAINSQTIIKKGCVSRTPFYDIIKWINQPTLHI